MEPWGDERPRTRGECESHERPCPWFLCQHNLLLDIKPDTGAVVVNTGRTTDELPVDGSRRRARNLTRRVPTLPSKVADAPRTKKGLVRLEATEEAILDAFDRAVELGTPTCALDVAEQGGITLEAAGDLMAITRERVRQLEVKVLTRLAAEPAIDELRQAARELPGEPETIWDRMGD